MKHLLALFLVFFTLTSYSQNPSQQKVGDVYFRHKDTGELIKINSKLWKIQKAGNVKELQIQLKNEGYDVDITGCIDAKTVNSFEANELRLKSLKKEARKEARLQRKKVRKKKT